MTSRSMFFCLSALTLACGPGEASTTSDAADTSDSTATTDDGASTAALPDDETTSDPSVADDTNAATDDGSEETSSSSSESGDAAASDGRFEITASGATIEPVGCAVERGPEPSAWTIEFTLPAGGSAFTMIETFGPHVGQHDCTLADGSFTCVRETAVDYSFAGQDAVVRLAAAYEVGWEGDGLTGAYTADFSCEGDDCASVVEEWQLTAFPCGVQVPFTGTLARQ
jgi:hypothetical protein